MVLAFKQIKAKRMKTDALRLRLLNTVRKTGREIRRDYEKWSATFDHDVEFEMIISLIGGPSVFVGTDDEIVRWLDLGTPPHPIPKKPKTDGFLQFQSEYIAKTKPGVIGSIEGGKSGTWRRKKQVQHPGFEARHITKDLKEKHEKILKKRVHADMKFVKNNYGR